MSTKLGAYMGKVLKVDLTTRQVEEYPWTDEDRKKYLGGKIMAAKLLSDFIFKPIDPLGEENVIAITTGPLNATASPCSSRFNISTVSPLTTLYTSSNCGGSFGLNLKRAGIDALIITGKSEEKIYIEIKDGQFSFINADKIWGTITSEAQVKMGAEKGGGTLAIGPAGENKVLYACVVSQNRCAGRGGTGAVFGSKNLKGIRVVGALLPEISDVERFRKVNKTWIKRLKTHPTTGKQLPTFGTAALVTPMQANSQLSTKNYTAGRYDKFEDISGETLTAEHLVTNKGCVSCPIQCARMLKVGEEVVKGPEVEVLGLLGSNILNNDIKKIFEWNYLLDEYGMDAISFANTLAFAMELNEKKMWDNGLEFGKIDNISDLIKNAAFRSDEVSSLIADGSRKISEKFGGKEFAMNVKGMELAAYEPRGAVGQGLGYAVANRGGCHLNGGYLVVLEGLGLHVNPRTPRSKAQLTIMFQDLMEAVSAGGNCLFTTYAFFPMPFIKKPNSIVTRIVNKVFEFAGGIVGILVGISPLVAINLPFYMLPQPMAISAASGLKLNFGNFLRIGERGYNLERAIDVRLGVSSKDDELPARLTQELQELDKPDSKVPLDVMRKKYYKTRKWDADGKPTAKILKKLGLEFMI